MAEQKEVTKWIAFIKKDVSDGTKHVICCEVKVLETPKQYHLIQSELLFHHVSTVCSYRMHINKNAKPCPLQDSEALAMKALYDECVCQVESAANNLKITENELHLVLDAVAGSTFSELIFCKASPA